MCTKTLIFVVFYLPLARIHNNNRPDVTDVFFR